ncbi:hypothetical protein BDW02DRAFT_649108 [Decorospora gaudefroyi]|uniref:Uncharacterized protein n=1 Tax=Decorospora gaudefroyi TaxID=184978 RepID=A0A6A5KGE7_9PLEO|nr:hypothetical protein BDW02DRAFT_649108 [Decorospora gaudefroyi]
MSYTSFFSLCVALKEYIEDILPTNTTDQPTIPFPTLPLELRELIYRYAILPGDPIARSQYLSFSAVDTAYGDDPRYLPWLPSLCRVNEAARLDVSLFLLRIAEFSILYPAQIPPFILFLETFPEGIGFSAIRRLDFQLFGRHRPLFGSGNPYIDFMKRCPNLSQIRIKFDVDYLAQQSWDWRDGAFMPPMKLQSFHRRVRELHDIIAVYSLKGILELDRLNKLTIEAWPRVRVGDQYGVENMLVDCAPMVRQLVQWLREGFRKKGREVEVLFVEASSPGLRWTGQI